MADILRIAVLLLGTLSLYRPQADAYKPNSNYRKDPRYGRPVLAMANSPRCMFNGRPVEDGRTVSSPEPCLNCTCSKGILLCYLRTCTTVVNAPGCQVVRRKGDCCPKLECNRGDTDYRTERTSEPSYKYRLRQDEGTFFGLIGMDPRTEKSGVVPITTTTRKPAPSPQYKNHDEWSSSKINRPSDEFDSPIEQEEDYGSDDLSPDRNDSAGNCYSKGYKYTDGMAMLSPTKCEYCYCIRGQQMCVRPKCHLNIDGCVARYQSGYTCCPSHYQCEIGAEGVNGDGYQLTPNGNADTPLNKVSSCNVEGYDFDVGVAVPSSGHCQTCYCTQVGVVCRRLECSPSVPGCIPVVPEGHCCPTEYKCDQSEGNETHVPVSHSTENYDVTVISPSGTDEGISSHAFETETTDDLNYEDGENDSTNFEDTTLDATTDKQKITVELTEDSDLESISVIPEENIAVLVLTTEKEKNAYTSATETTEGTRLIPDTTKLEPSAIPPSSLKHKTKSSTTKTASTQTGRTRYPFETTRPAIITLANLKQKIRTSTAKEASTETGETGFFQDTTKPAIELINLKHKTKTSTTKRVSTDAAEGRTDKSTPYHSTRETDSTTETSEKSSNEEPDYDDEEKDNYAYDYVELYDDVTHDEHETFVPFSDYTETTYGGRITPSEETEGTTSNTRFKIKNKRPSSKTHYPTTQTVTSFTNSKFATDGLKPGEITEIETVPDPTTFSTIAKSEKYTNPTSYTIYSTTSDKTHRPYATESTGRHKQKTKPNTKPIYYISTQPEPSTTQHSTPPHLVHTQTSTRGTEIDEYQTTSHQKSNTPDITETSRPSLLLLKQHNKIISNHKQKLPRPPQTALPYKSTKPLPQDIATLLYQHITQKYSPQTQDTSTETYDRTTKQETHKNKLSGSPVYSPDTSTFVIAAPKLIVEDVTEESDSETSQYETTNTDITTSSTSNSSSSGPPLPSFNFQSPEIIFSNHGPSSHKVHDSNHHQKQPTKVHDPNNHHKQPTKINDPNNHHMQPTKVHDPTLPVLINNHKKTSTRIRPPIRFRPPSTPSVPQTSFIEISNHRPTNSFRRPPSKFPPYPSYNLRSEAEYRIQPNARDPLKLHRIVPESHPEWREDYDEYYYELEQNRNPSTRVFTNFQDYQTTGTINVKSTTPDVQSPGSRLQPTTRKNDVNTNPVTVASREEQDEVNKTVSETSESAIRTESQDDIAGRSSDNKITETTRTTYQTTVSTTPFPTTILNIATSTTSFSRDTIPDDEGKLFRAEDNKDTETSFIDPNQGQYEGKQNKFEVLDGRPSAERPVLKPFSTKTSSVQPKDPPQSEEDSKEINDVCFVDGRYYNSGEIIVKSNPCEMCRCFYGHPLCQVQQCPSPPEPSCVLEYLPGYCCPRVTCGVKMDSAQSSSDVSVPDPTSQEIRPPIITLDNQWKPLPHGPVLRPVENIPKVEAISPERIPEVVTLRPFPIEIEEESKDNAEEESILESENSYDTEFRNPDITINPEKPSTSLEVTSTPSMFSSRTTVATTQSIAPRTTIAPIIEVTTYFPDLPITTSPGKPQGPIFDPESEKSGSQKNKSTDIHDNSSGVRKILDETVTLPPSKVSLSPSGGENISTVLPVIQALPTVAYNTESPLQEVDTVANFVLGDLPAELGGNLKVSGCNVYGKYYKINDIVTALSKPCSDCICSADGIACNASC